MQTQTATTILNAVQRLRMMIAIMATCLPLLAGTAHAQQTSEQRGSVTNLPLPRFVSMKSATGNVRRGPSLNHRIDWVFKRKGLPLEITAEYGHWRRVQFLDGSGGWVHYALLSGTRTVIVEHDMIQVLARPQADADVLASFELGVVAQLERCTLEWCEISAGGYMGWVPKSAIWGVFDDEIRE